jgi:glycosyltransferase involved in cell wall biosynthesis
MRIALLATRFADYSVEAADALAREADLLLLADKEHLDADSCAGKRRALAAAGRLAEFRQRRFHRLGAVALCLWRIARFRPDVVIAHIDPRLHATLLYRLLSHLAPLLLIVHDPLPHTGRDWAPAMRRRWLVKWQVAAARLFFAHGPYCAKLWAAPDNPFGRVNGRRIAVLPHGPVLRPEGAVAELPSRCRVLMFGRMEAYKGLDVLLAALRLLVERQVDVELRLAGQGPELDRLEGEFRATGRCSIHNGFVPREAAIREFRDAALVVAPYTNATQSGVVAAAFAHARPVVASRVGGLPDFVHHGENGLLVPASDPVALADAIQSIAENRGLLYHLATGARASSAGEMSWDVFAARGLDAIRGTLNQESGSATTASLRA